MLEERLLHLKNVVNSLSYQNRPIIIWGMGEYASFVTRSLNLTENLKIEAFTDGFSQGDSKFAGIQTINASKCVEYENPLVLLCIKNPEIIKKTSSFLDSINVDSMTFDEFVVGKNYEKVTRCISLCADDKSKYIYTELLKRRLDNCFDGKDLVENDPYFAIPQFIEENFNEVYVDLGAFVGDSLESFLFKRLTSFKTYYAFEPDEKNYLAMQYRIDRLEKEWNMPKGKVVPVCSAVGAKQEKLFFSNGGIATSGVSVKGEGSVVNVVTLDEFFKDININTIKADIESFEYPMLLGGENVIRNNRPKLAISIYHSMLDFYNIMSWVDSLDLGYKFWIRHHSARMSDTIMYAVCEQKN